MLKPLENLKIEKVDRKQLFWRTVDVEELVAADDPVRAIWQLTERVDLSQFYLKVLSVAGEPGREAIDPRLLVCVWVYAYSQGISSGREVSRLMEYHPGFQWLTGMRVINHHTLSDFRIEHGAALDELFTQILGLLSSEGLISLERVMQDGTKIKANAGSDQFRREDRLQEHLRLAREQVKAMDDPHTAAEVTPRVRAAQARAAREKEERLQQALQELEKIRAAKHRETPSDQARANRTDPECRVMKHGAGGGYSAAYNLQVTTDAKAGAIIGLAVTQDGADTEQLVPAVEQVEQRLGQKPDQMVADAGYTTHANVLAMTDQSVDFIGSIPPVSAKFKDDRFRPEAFKEDGAGLRCPNGKLLILEKRQKRFFGWELTYRAQRADCQRCPMRAQCSPDQARRSVTVRQLLPVLTAFRQRMETPEAQAIYRQRGGIAEFSNAWIKDKLGLRQFRLRRLIKVNIEALWVCLTHNLQLWMRRVWRPALSAT